MVQHEAHSSLLFSSLRFASLRFSSLIFLLSSLPLLFSLLLLRYQHLPWELWAMGTRRALRGWWCIGLAWALALATCVMCGSYGKVPKVRKMLSKKNREGSSCSQPSRFGSFWSGLACAVVRDGGSRRRACSRGRRSACSGRAGPARPTIYKNSRSTAFRGNILNSLIFENFQIFRFPTSFFNVLFTRKIHGSVPEKWA